MRKKVVITEPVDTNGIEILQKDTQVVYLPELSGRSLAGEITDAHALAVRVAKVPRELIEQAKNLTIIVKHGVGYDNIDVRAATEKGIPVVNTPEANVESVAEHNLGLMLALSKRIISAHRALRQGSFEARESYTGNELQGKKLGVIGLGRTGYATALKCKLAFDMDILTYAHTVTAEQYKKLDCTKVTELGELLNDADYIVVCVPLTGETRNLIGLKELGTMKPDAYLVNSSRGGIVDEAALYQVLAAGGIAGAAMDVFTEEPLSSTHPLLTLDNFIATPHIAGVTAESMRRISIAMADEIMRVFNGEKPEHPVNPVIYTR